jgi:hypothetical protein
VDVPDDRHEFCDFNSAPVRVREFLDRVRASGGGDNEEDLIGAAQIVGDLSWKSDACKSVCWIADSSAHGEF